MGLTYNLAGFAELDKALSELSTDVATKIGQAADRAGAMVIAKAVSDAAPDGPTAEGVMETRHGREIPHAKIKNHVKVKKTKNVSPTKVQTTITTTTAIQALWEEFGSIHNAPTRFMSKAVGASAQAAIDQIAATLRKRIDKANK